MKKSILFTIVVFCFCACSITPSPEFAPTNYILQAQKNTAIKDLKPNHKNIKIMPVQSPLYLKSEEIIYIKDGSLAAYAKHFWKNPPNDSFELMLTQKFEESGIFKAVLNQNSQVVPDLLLESKLFSFEQNFDKDKNFVSVRLSANLIEARDKSLLAHKYFEFDVDVEKLDANSAALAFNKALNQLSDELLLWIAQSLNTK